MRILLFIAVLLLSLPSALAQENFTHLTQPKSEKLDQQLGLSVPYTEKKYAALDPVNKVIVKYYDYCMAHNHPMMFYWAKKRQCICTADRIPEVMPPPDILAMAEDTPKGQEKRREMLLRAFGPCMEEPVRRVTEALCKSDRESLRRMKQPEEFCGCLADMTRQSVARDARDIVARALSADPASAMPLTVFLSSDEYFDLSRVMTKICFSHFENPPPPYPGIPPNQWKQNNER